MPTLASMWTRMPPTSNDCSSAARSRSPAALAVASSPGVEHDRELVAAEPRERVVLAQQRPQPRADLAQHLVARVMAERVVELLEAVEVDEQQRELVAVSRARRDRRVEPVDEVAAVAEPGQVVGHRLLSALAQALDDGQPGARHPGQHGDDGERDGDGVEARRTARR